MINMSVPPINYCVPPPRLDMPPPTAAPAASIPTATAVGVGPNKLDAPAVLSAPTALGALDVSTAPLASAKIYSHPPPFPVPAIPVDKPPPYLLPPLNVPPPTFYSTPIDILKVPPPVPPYPPPTIPPEYPFQGRHMDLSILNKGKMETQVTSLSNETNEKIKENRNLSPDISERSYNSDLQPKRSSHKYHHYRDYPTSSKHRYSPHSERSYDRERREREREKERYMKYKHREHRSSRSPSHHRHHHSRSPSSHRHRERVIEEYRRDREQYRRERERHLKYEHDRRRYELEKMRGPSYYRDPRSHSRSHDPHYERRCRSPSRHGYHSPGRESRSSHHSPGRESRSSHHSHPRELSPRYRQESAPRKPLTDREKILEEYRKKYCKTSKDFIERMEQWSKEHNSDEEETSKMWYRSSPAELYYKLLEGGNGVQQTSKLEILCESFYNNLIQRGHNARPATDELPPLKPPKAKMCNKHRMEEGSSSSCESDEYLDEDGLQGYTDRIMLELQRKQSHPRRLHPEMWFNNTGEMNGGPLCRCSARARRHGMRHGVYAGEQVFPKCIPTQSNLNSLYHYRITVSPPTNFLIKAPTIIGHDEHEFLFSGFSMFSHYKLAKLPTCKVIRFNIEYTILYVEEPAPQNFTIQELDLFEEYLFKELLELVDLDLGKGTENSCSQFHFMPRFVRFLPEGGCEVLSMSEILKYLIDESGLLISPDTLDDVHSMDHYTWQKFVDRIKGMIVTYPGKKPCSVRVDQLDRSLHGAAEDVKMPKESRTFYPEIVHFGIRPPQLSYAGNPEYQKAWRYYVKYRHLIANMAKPSFKEKQKLAAKEARLQEMRTQSKMKRDVTVAISSEGFHTTGLMCDVVQHAMLIPVLVRHLRFHKSLDSLEEKIGYVFKQRLLLQTALTHPSYRENFGTNPDHARNSLTNCGIRQPEYGDRRIHYTRKKGIVTLINIMSRFGKHNETESEIKHNERLEFLGDAVVEFLSSIHLFRMFPGLAEGGLATYRASMVQNQHLAQLAKNISLEQFMLYAHGSDLCREVVMRHAMANCFEALMGALFLDAGLQVADRVFALSLWYSEPDLLEVWTKDRAHPLQEQEPLGDRNYIKKFDFLQRLTEFEESIGVTFKHIRLLARAFTDRSVGFTHLTLGSNQRLEFLGDTVLQLVVSDRLYRYFPDHHEGHLSLLRSSLVNKRTQAMVCDDLNMSTYAIYNNPKAKPTTKKHKADLLEAFLGALFIDKNLEYCQAFCNACLFPRLQEFIMNQDWNDPKSKLQQCCLTLRSMEGGEPDIPLYKVINCLGPTNTRVYEVGVYFRGKRLAAARGHSIQEAEMNAAEQALAAAHELFPQLDHQKRVIAKSMKKKKKNRHRAGRGSPTEGNQNRFENMVPKAYRLNKDSDSSDESSTHANLSDDEKLDKSDNDDSDIDKSDDDSGLVSDTESTDKLDNVKVSSLLTDMEKLKEDLIRRNEYEKFKEKVRNADSDDD